MSASRVVLWRHGQTDMDLMGRTQGARDFSLNDTGLRQAREAAAALAPLEPSLIVSSPLTRARQTVGTLSSLVRVDVEADDRLKERSLGLFEGLTGAEIEEGFLEQCRAWRRAKEPEGVGAERQVGVGRQANRAIEDWAAKTNGTLMVASHGAVIKLATISLLDEAPGEWMGPKVMFNCNWTILEPLCVGPPVWRIAAHSVGAGRSDGIRTPTQ